MRLQPFVLIVLNLTCFLFGAQAQSPEENKKIITHYLLEIFSGKKLELLGEVFPGRFVRHDLNDSTDTWMTVDDQKNG